MHNSQTAVIICGALNALSKARFCHAPNSCTSSQANRQLKKLNKPRNTAVLSDKIKQPIYSSSVSSNLANGTSEGCRPREKLYSQFMISNPKKGMLRSFHLKCTTEIVYEVRYANEELCRCGRITTPGRKLFETCQTRSSMDFLVVISTEKVRNQWGESCTFTFILVNKTITTMLPFEISIFPEKIVSSNFRTSTSSIGQPSTMSSLMISQTELGHSTTSLTGQIRYRLV